MNTTFKAISSAVASVAPTIADMLLGPFAGAAVKSLEEAFNLPEGSGVDKITAVVQAGNMTPEMVAKVRAADQAHAEAMQRNQIDLIKMNQAHEEAFAKADVDDRDSARRLAIETKAWTPATLTWMIVLGTFILYGYLFVYGNPQTLDDIIVGRILGTLDTAFGMCLAYWLGSSAGSRAKDTTISNMAK